MLSYCLGLLLSDNKTNPKLNLKATDAPELIHWPGAPKKILNKSLVCIVICKAFT